MLVQFNFRNFKSFKNETTLDLTATSITEHPYNLSEIGKGDKYLRIAAIYGANASGKSGVITAFRYMRFYVLNSLKFGEDEEDDDLKNNIIFPKFLFNKLTKNQPTEFEVFFIINGTEYQYGFIVDEKKVHSEWLYGRRINSKKLDTLFERINNKVTVGEKLKKAEIFKDSVEDRTLFLTLTAKTKVSLSKKVVKWFRDTSVIDFGDVNFENIISHTVSPELNKNEIYKEKLEEFLIAIDSGIKGIRVEVDNEKCNSNECELFSIHESDDGNNVEMGMYNESSGTQKMLCLFDFFWESMRKGSVLFIDELNAKLHPLLVRYIINMFHNPSINVNSAQLVYTTHDIYTLTRDTFRRDEVWFTEKDKNGVSSLYSLVEYKFEDNSKVRKDASYSKDYLMGRYGAIPLLKEFNIMEEK